MICFMKIAIQECSFEEKRWAVNNIEQIRKMMVKFMAA